MWRFNSNFLWSYALSMEFASRATLLAAHCARYSKKIMSKFITRGWPLKNNYRSIVWFFLLMQCWTPNRKSVSKNETLWQMRQLVCWFNLSTDVYLCKKKCIILYAYLYTIPVCCDLRMYVGKVNGNYREAWPRVCLQS